MTHTGLREARSHDEDVAVLGVQGLRATRGPALDGRGLVCPGDARGRLPAMSIRQISVRGSEGGGVGAGADVAGATTVSSCGNRGAHRWVGSGRNRRAQIVPSGPRRTESAHRGRASSARRLRPQDPVGGDEPVEVRLADVEVGGIEDRGPGMTRTPFSPSRGESGGQPGSGGGP